MRWILFKCILLASITAVLAYERPKRDLLQIRNYITSMLIGVTTPNVAKEKVPQRMDSFKLYRIPGFENILINVTSIAPQDKRVVPVNDKVIETNPKVAIIEVTSRNETSVVVENVKKLLNPGIPHDNHDGLKITEEVTPRVIHPSPQEHNITANSTVPLKTKEVVNDEKKPNRSQPAKAGDEINHELTSVFPAAIERRNQSDLAHTSTKYSYEQVNSNGPDVTYISNNNGDVIVTASAKAIPLIPSYVTQRIQEVASLCDEDFEKRLPFRTIPTFQMSEHVPSYPPVYNVPRFNHVRNMDQYIYPSGSVTVKPPPTLLHHPSLIGDIFENVAASQPFGTDHQIFKNADCCDVSHNDGYSSDYINQNPIEFQTPLLFNHIYQPSYIRNTRQPNPVIATFYSNPHSFHKVKENNDKLKINKATAVLPPHFTNGDKNETTSSANKPEVSHSVELTKNIYGYNKVNIPKTSVLHKEPALTNYVYNQIYRDRNPNVHTVVNVGDQITEGNRGVNIDGKIHSQLLHGYVFVPSTVYNEPITTESTGFTEAGKSSQKGTDHAVDGDTVPKKIQAKDEISKDSIMPLSAENSLKHNPLIIPADKMNCTDKRVPADHTSINTRVNSDGGSIDVKHLDSIYNENKNRGDIPDVK